MKIALIHRYYPMAGGVTTVIKYLKEELEKNNEVVLITNDSSCKEKNTKFLPGKDFSFYLSTYKYIKDNDFDIVHTQSFPFCYFSPFLKIPVILTVQGYDKIYDWPKKFSLKIKIILATLARGISYRFIDKIVAISDIIKENISKKWKINSKKIEVIHNGVDSARFFPDKKNSLKNKKFRVFIYSMTKRKGFDKLLEWMPELVREIPQIEIVVAGSGNIKPDEKFSKYFNLLGQVNFSDMPKVMNSVDVVLLPSVDEPFGITAAEGMACGKPAIISKQSGVADVIDNKNSISCEIDDFPQKIIYLAKNKAYREKMGRLARETVQKKLSADYLSKQHIKLYKVLRSSE